VKARKRESGLGECARLFCETFPASNAIDMPAIASAHAKSLKAIRAFSEQNLSI
jgi:hypothetical protein